MEQCIVHQTGLVLTMACNLKCKLCSNYSPYYQKPDYYTMDYLREQMKRYFAIVTHVKKLMVTGGEPNLHPDLGEFILEIKKYQDQVDIFGVITNGSILPDEKVLRAAKEYGDKFHFLIDDYGPELSVKAQELAEILDKWEIAYILRKYHGGDAHCGGWVYFGDLTEKNMQRRKMWKLFSESVHILRSCILPLI